MNTSTTKPVGTLASWFCEKLISFLAKPASARPLAALRIGLATLLLIQAFALSGNVLELYGNRGFVQWTVVEGGTPEGIPRIRWVADALSPVGVQQAQAVSAVFLLYLASLAGLLVGWHTRVAAALAWLTHLAMNESGNACLSGMDQFAHIALFYCVWMPVGHDLSVDRVTGRVSGTPTSVARVALRVLQLHLCVVYFASGIEKASGEQWWNGEAIWRAVMRPDLGQFNFTWLADVPWLAMLAAWATLVVEIGYPFLVWHQDTRQLWILSTVGLHLGIAVTLGLLSFAVIMIVLNVSAFLVCGEPKAVVLATGKGEVPTTEPLISLSVREQA
jgi:hypothetical protein